MLFVNPIQYTLVSIVGFCLCHLSACPNKRVLGLIRGVAVTFLRTLKYMSTPPLTDIPCFLFLVCPDQYLSIFENKILPIYKIKIIFVKMYIEEKNISIVATCFLCCELICNIAKCDEYIAQFIIDIV